MPKKIVVAVTYSEKMTNSDGDSVGDGVRNIQRVAAMYFSNEWDQYYRETFYNDVEKQVAYERLQLDLILALDMTIGEETPRNATPSPSSAASQRTMVDKHNMQATPCYIHRVAVDRSSQRYVYHIIYYRKGVSESVGCQVISQAKINQLKADVVNSFQYFLGDPADFQTEIGNDLAEVAPRLLELDHRLQKTINRADQVAFINFFNNRTSGLRITQQIIFPKQKLSHVNYVRLYEKLLPGRYGYVDMCIRDFRSLAPRFEKVDSVFKRALAEQLIDADAENYRFMVTTKAWFLTALQPLNAIQTCLESVARQKKIAKEAVFLLKERLIWVIQEAARQYYVDKCHAVLLAAKKDPAIKAQALKAINKQFLNVVHISNLFRLSFVNLQVLAIEALFELYHQLLARARDNTYLKDNMRLVYQESLAHKVILFAMAENGKCTLQQVLFDWLTNQHENIIDQHYLPESEGIQENLKLFNGFIDIASCVEQNRETSVRQINERLQMLKWQLAQCENAAMAYGQTFASMGVEIDDEPEEEYKQEYKAASLVPSCASTPTPTPVSTLIHAPAPMPSLFASTQSLDSLQQDRLHKSRAVSVSQPGCASTTTSTIYSSTSTSTPLAVPHGTDQSSIVQVEPVIEEKTTLFNVEEIEYAARQREVLRFIENIMNNHIWWHAQLKGYGGDKDLGVIKVPRGIARMLKIMDTKNPDGLSLSPFVRLTAYQQIAKKRLETCNWANFFKTRMTATTKQFYQYLLAMDVNAVTDRDQANFLNFWTLVVKPVSIDPLSRTVPVGTSIDNAAVPVLP